eukprot:2876771-Karenia_brevis.AAC.1
MPRSLSLGRRLAHPPGLAFPRLAFNSDGSRGSRLGGEAQPLFSGWPPPVPWKPIAMVTSCRFCPLTRHSHQQT